MDTSILLSVPEKKTRIFEGIKRKLGKVEFFVPTPVLKELTEIKKQKGKKEDVKIVEKTLEKNNVKKIERNEKKADNSLVELGSKGYAIATLDRELKKRIKEFGGKIIYLKKGTIIEVE